MGSPLGQGGWSDAAVYYTGAGGAELAWLLVSIGLCVAALVVGARHERAAYRRQEAATRGRDEDTARADGGPRG